MNDESLRRANAFLSAVAARTAVGQLMDVTPAQIGLQVGLPDPLSIARAVRALVARRRLEPVDHTYRLLESKSVEPGEKESLGRRPRKKRQPAAPSEGRAPRSGATAYSDLGRAAVDRLVELSRENAQLRAIARQAREEARDAATARDDAERRARTASERLKELEHRADMAESNLRSLLASARPGQKHDAAVPDSEMEAILGVLKGSNGDAGEAAEQSESVEPTGSPEPSEAAERSDAGEAVTIADAGAQGERDGG
jgi:hypothetical protein